MRRYHPVALLIIIGLLFPLWCSAQTCPITSLTPAVASGLTACPHFNGVTACCNADTDASLLSVFKLAAGTLGSGNCNANWQSLLCSSFCSANQDFFATPQEVGFLVQVSQNEGNQIFDSCASVCTPLRPYVHVSSLFNISLTSLSRGDTFFVYSPKLIPSTSPVLSFHSASSAFLSISFLPSNTGDLATCNSGPINMSTITSGSSSFPSSNSGRTSATSLFSTVGTSATVYNPTISTSTYTTHIPSSSSHSPSLHSLFSSTLALLLLACAFAF